MTGSKPLGRSLKLFLTDGSPSGLIVAEMGVSSLRVLVANRTSLPELVKRQEASRTGVYLLQGELEDQTSLVYVGEGDSVKARLSAHDADESKSFFDRVALVVSKDENLTKAHGRYLESRLIKMIARAGQAALANATSPSFDGLPEAEIADMERVLDEVTTILPVLGFDLFKLATKTQAAAPNMPSNTFSTEEQITFVAKVKTAEARAFESSGDFVLLAGSTIQREQYESLAKSLSERKQRMMDQGLLVDCRDPELLELVEDAVFSSPSYASAFVAGRADNGRTTWKTHQKGETYADWRKQEFSK